MLEINLLAVLVASVAVMAIGFAWYSPSFFGKKWIALSGLDTAKMEESMKDSKGMGSTFLAAFLSTFVMVYMFAFFMEALAWNDIMGGLRLGFWMWLGFNAPVLLSSVLWERKPFELYLLNISYYLVVFLVIGGIVGLLG